MPPRLSSLAPRRLAFRTTPVVPRKRLAPIQSRLATNDASKGPTQSNSGEPTVDVDETTIPHVTEEQAALDKVMGQEPPEIEERGTPVQEILQRDKDAQEKAPKVLKEEIKSSEPGKGQSRSYSTQARRQAAHVQSAQFDGTRALGLDYPDAGVGHKFALPELQTWTTTDHLRRRYDPVVDQVTKMLMRDGKLSQAQKNMNKILETLRTAPPPQSSTHLISDSPINTDKTVQNWIKRDQLPLSPIQYLSSVIDSVAPLLKIRQQRGVLGGGQSMAIPVPLRVKQRRRTAIKWILDSAESNRDTYLADRVAKELIKVANGTSSAWEKRAAVHRMAISARSNLRTSVMRKRKIHRF